jgi:hypothetical protein
MSEDFATVLVIFYEVVAPGGNTGTNGSAEFSFHLSPPRAVQEPGWSAPGLAPAWA